MARYLERAMELWRFDYSYEFMETYEDGIHYTGCVSRNTPNFGTVN